MTVFLRVGDGDSDVLEERNHKLISSLLKKTLYASLCSIVSLQRARYVRLRLSIFRAPRL